MGGDDSGCRPPGISEKMAYALNKHGLKVRVGLLQYITVVARTINSIHAEARDPTRSLAFCVSGLSHALLAVLSPS